MVFSGTVKIGDLNDFIAPSQACVVALQEDSRSAPADPRAEAHVQLHARPPPAALKPGGGFQQTYTQGDGGAVRVTLQDCLACSGCVTSAETVLLQHQSREEFEAKLKDAGTVVVVSVSPQSRASLAALHGLPAAQVQAKLAAFLHSLGVAAVLDVADARELSRCEEAAEFLERFRRSRECSTSDGDPAGAPLPLLTSACPGWVCYAEKTHGDALLPHLSTAKSPQAIMGTFVKRTLAPARGWRAGAVYHCSVMPCYDKKLEASREDLRVPGTAVAEVDTCLTTGEMQELLDAAGVKLAALADGPTLRMMDVLPPAPDGGSGAWTSVGVADGACGVACTPRGGSGGYLEAVFREAAERLFGRRLPPDPLPLRTGRNPDLCEVELAEEGTGKPLLRFASAYGFRNIQALVRKAKAGRCPYDYVEVMACPGGCLNGAGQLKPAPGETAGQLLDRLEALYHAPLRPAAADSGPCIPVCSAEPCEGRVALRGGGCSEAARELYTRWVGGPPGSNAARALLHTEFHKRERTVVSAVSDW